MPEEAEAVKAIAETAGKAIDGLRELGKFIAKFTQGPLDEAAGIVQDRLKYLRWKQLLGLMQKADELLAQRKLRHPTRAVPLRIAMPLLQAGSIEEDEQLQYRWAALLVNAGDASSGVEVRRAFVSILEDLSSLDAIVLERIYAAQPVQDKGADTVEIWTKFLPERANVEKPKVDNYRPTPDVETALGNLLRLGLLTSAMTWGGIRMLSCVYRTRLGHEFVRACSRDRPL